LVEVWEFCGYAPERLLLPAVPAAVPTAVAATVMAPTAACPAFVTPTAVAPAMSEAEIDRWPWRTVGGRGIDYLRSTDYRGILVGDRRGSLVNGRWRGIDGGCLIVHRRGWGTHHQARQRDTDSEVQTHAGVGGRRGAKENSD
jgi:hypothetical protein